MEHDRRHLVSARELAAQALRRLPAASRADLAAALGHPVPRALRVRAIGGPARRPGPDRVPLGGRAGGGDAVGRPGRAGRCALNWLIRSAGLVTWDDLFDGNGDPRDFEDVVRRKGLTPEQLRRAGIAEGVARRAGGPPG